jgi:transposase-like protein
MKNRANPGLPAQVGAGLLPTAQQLLLPMIEGIVHTRRELFAWIQQVGINALQELFELDVVEMAGAKGKHCPARSHYRWGAAPIVLPFGGQRITVPCPRIRAVGGGEAQLRSAHHFRSVDPVPARVLNQILLGVSTRGYRHSLEPVPAGISARGASKSAASRHLIARMSGQLREQLRRRLDQLDLLVLMVDGIEIAHRTVVVALGILADGRKVVLGLWLGSTENAALCTALLNDLLERGLKVDGRILCVIDGGRGIRKALEDVFGDLAVVQRCRVHKKRNILDHLPPPRKAYVSRMLTEAWSSDSATLARRRLKTLLQWFESNGENGAAGSLREGMEETLTVAKLDLPGALRTFLVTTNAIENLIGTSRRISRNVKRWRSGEMIVRWTAIGLAQAEKNFRRVRGYRHLPLLVRALRQDAVKIDRTEEAA